MKLRVLVAAAAAVLLAGCGSVHPGAAAVVDDTVISMDDADDTAQVYCRLTLLQGVQGQPPSNADIRREAVRDLVIGAVARDLAEQQGIEPNASSYAITPAQRRELAKAFPADQVEGVIDVIQHTQQTYAIVQKLGERAADVPATDDAGAIQQAGLKVVKDELARHDVSYDPRFGLKDDGDKKSVSSALSVSPKTLDESSMKGLPATQRCI